MNIFILDSDHKKNVQYYCDKHVVKMILEHAQMLSTAVRLSGIDAGYKSTHINHPCNIWVRESLSNWFWLRELTGYLHGEWLYRFQKNKFHKSFEMIRDILPIPNIEDKGLTPFVQAVPEQYKCDDPVKTYRQYYINEKQHLYKWTNRERPFWISTGV